MKKIIVILLFLVFLAGAFVSGFKIFHILKEYRAGEAAYGELQSYAPVIDFESEEPEPLQTEPESSDSDTNTNTNAAAVDKPHMSDPAPVFKEPDFAALYSINTDVAAWIYISGTNINYPVVQGSDNDYYLNHLFNKKLNGSGCIFLDCRNDNAFTDPNSIIYGHSMKNGTMFASLKKYKKQSFYDKHPVFRLFTPGQEYTVEIFAGYVAEPNDQAWRTSFESDEAFAQWINERIERSAFKSNITPSPEDRIITLSTCTYEFNDARFVLFGRIVQN